MDSIAVSTQTPIKPLHTDAIGTDRAYALRPCPSCGSTIFGMPGGKDAYCPTCGYKDPCCSD